MQISVYGSRYGVRILQGKEADVVMRQDDILYIATTEIRAAVKAGGVGIIIGIATAFPHR